MCNGDGPLREVRSQEDVPRGPMRPCRENTVIILDWDDTLLCSSALRAGYNFLSTLQPLESRVDLFLAQAQALGDTRIVTNGDRSWVQESALRCMPRLLPTLSQLKVLSARAAYEDQWPGDPVAWKCQAFKEILSGWVSRNPGCSFLNLVVIGDSVAEIEAAKEAVGVLEGPYCLKTLKFKEMPLATEVLAQLEVTQRELQMLTQSPQSAHLLMTQFGTTFSIADPNLEANEVVETSAAENLDLVAPGPNLVVQKGYPLSYAGPETELAPKVHSWEAAQQYQPEILGS